LGVPGSSIAAFDQDRWARERRLFEVLLPDGHKLWPDWLRKIDTLLEDATGKPRRVFSSTDGGPARTFGPLSERSFCAQRAAGR
jgi:hypothetical protein